MSDKFADIQAGVRSRFGRIAAAPQQEQKFPLGPDSAKALGYDPAEIDRLPPSLTESFCGVGNPLSLGDLAPGQRVLDLGCGAGLDALLAARRVGPSGSVVGVDLTPPMVAKARTAAASLDVENVRFVLSSIETLPLADESFDVAISNGVLNLCPDKPAVLAEVFRVLRPAGRLQLADILLDDSVGAELLARKGAWSD